METTRASFARSGVYRSCAGAWWLAILALVPAAASAWLHPRAPAFAWERPLPAGTISRAAALELNNALWVDARSPEEFANGHVPGAILLPPREWDTHVEALLMEWQPGRPIVVYCGGGGCEASQAVARRLREELGLSDVWVLDGGWRPREVTP